MNRDYRKAPTDAATATPDPGATAVLLSAASALEPHSDGVVRLRPRGSGWRYLISLLLAIEWQAQAQDTRRRLKVCRNPRCRVAFYDRSRNRSAVWCQMAVCGNRIKTKAYRERRQARPGRTGRP